MMQVLYKLLAFGLIVSIVICQMFFPGRVTIKLLLHASLLIQIWGFWVMIHYLAYMAKNMRLR